LNFFRHENCRFEFLFRHIGKQRDAVGRRRVASARLLVQRQHLAQIRLKVGETQLFFGWRMIKLFMLLFVFLKCKKYGTFV
jgi:hypothetical protein